MNDRNGKWHAVVINKDGDDVTFDVLHPHSCPWSIEFHPRVADTHGTEMAPARWEQHHVCDVAFDLAEYGWSDANLDPGFYWLQLEHIVYPGGPWGATEYDIGMNWIAIERPHRLWDSASPSRNPDNPTTQTQENER